MKAKSLRHAILAGAMLGLSAPAHAADAVQGLLTSKIEAAKIQNAAADRDIALADSVYRAFYTVRLNGARAAAADFNRALNPLRVRYPDYRLHYDTAADVCRIQRTISDARVSALRRKEEALRQEMDSNRWLMLYSALQLQYRLAGLQGQRFTEKNMEQAFLQVMDKEVPVPQTTFTNMDYLPASAKDPDDCD